MSNLHSVAGEYQKEIIAQFHEILEQNGIKESVLMDAQEMAKVAGKHILDPSNPDLTEFPPIPIEDGKDVEFFLILDFLQCAGFKFASNVLKFESQHPDLSFDRRQFGKALGLKAYDKTPYLVQLIEKMRRNE